VFGREIFKEELVKGLNSRSNLTMPRGKIGTVQAEGKVCTKKLSLAVPKKVSRHKIEELVTVRRLVLVSIFPLKV
jgi:hypothetical protein